MNEDLIDIDITAQLSLHAIPLEQLFANVALSKADPSESWQAMNDSIMDICKYKLALPDDMPEQMIVQERICHFAIIFCNRVAVRVKESQEGTSHP